MKKDFWSIGECIKELFGVLNISKFHYSIIFLFSLIFYFSLGFDGNRTSVYSVGIEPSKSVSGPVKLVFYDSRYQDYLALGALKIPAIGWTVTKATDSTTLTAEGNAPPLILYVEDEPITYGLIHYPEAGEVRVVDSNNFVQLISLRSSTEYISTQTINAKANNPHQPNSGIAKYSVPVRVGVFLSLFLLLTFIVKLQLKGATKSLHQLTSVSWLELVSYAIPLFLSTTLVLLAYWPANVAYDASLQWYQAVTRGTLDAPIGISATLFLRIFSYFSENPAWVILVQSALSAIGVAFTLRELRFIGVPRWVAQVCALLIAIQPQYPLFFTNLGKDALSATGLIFLAWSLLSTVRHLKNGQLMYRYISIFIVAAVFSGMMRFNVMPATLLVVVIFSIYLFCQKHRPAGLLVLFLFLLGVVCAPKAAFYLSDEYRLTKVELSGSGLNDAKVVSQDTGLPLGFFGNFYIYHIFGAAASSGLVLNESDERLFLRIAPRSAWEKYDCFMTDTTFASVLESKLLNPIQYRSFLIEHQLDMAYAVFNIVKNNPSILLARQACISKMLWFIGYKQKPFQVTSTLGYDNVTAEFKAIAGESRSLVAENLRSAIQLYVSWSEKKSNFWLFWKPALICYIGLFCALSYMAVNRDIGLILMLSIPVAMTCVLAIVIPFPAYRYAYPANLLMSLLCTLAFVSPLKRKQSA